MDCSVLKNPGDIAQCGSALPLARIEAGAALPLSEGVNPAWAAAVGRLRTEVVEPLLGPRTALTAAEWAEISGRFAALEAWLARKKGALVEPLGLARVRVEDAAKHGALANLSRTYLAYCDCVRRGSDEKMTVACAFTAGDSDNLLVGRNGVFCDRKGRDWDATITKIVDHPISVGQAFWSPYKRVARMIGEQIEKVAGAREKAVQDSAATGIAHVSAKAEAGKAPPPAPFDIAKFAGIFAAIGLAVGAIGTAIASVLTGFLALSPSC